MNDRLSHAILVKPFAVLARGAHEEGRAAFFVVVALFVFFFSISALASSNQSFIYQGRIIRPDGSSANSGTIAFTLSVYSPAPSECLLYQETQSVSMTGSYGLFKLALGTGSRTDGGVHTFLQTFVNGSTLSGLTCASGTSYTAGSTDDRELRVSFNDAGTTVSLAGMAIKSVPFALQAHEIEGWGLSNLVKVSSIGSPTTFTISEMANAKALAGAACALNEILKWDGSAWACASDATAGSPNDASFAAKGIVQGDTDVATSGLTFTSGVIKVNAGTAANQIVKLDSSAKLPGVDGSALTNLDPTHLSAAVAINKGGTGQITAILGFNALSPITTKGDLITSDGTNNVRLPAGSNGYVLTADSAQSSGVKWAPVTAGTVTSVSSANSDISVASGASTPVLTLNSGTGNNQIVKLDGSAKLPAVDGSALTNLNAGNIASGTLPVSRGGTGATSFAGNAVIISNNAGTALQALNCTSGQVITFDASGYAVCGAAAGSNGFVNGGNSFGANATLGTNDNYSLDIKTNNTSRMTILATGEVGIGTTSPANALQVAGTIGVGVSTGKIQMGSDSSVIMGLGITTAGTSKNSSVVVGLGNNLGAGMAADQSVVVGYANSVSYNNSVAMGRGNNTGYGDTSVAIGNSNSATQDGGVALGSGNTAPTLGVAIGRNITNTVAASLQIGPSDNAKMTILSSGNVGIGTTSPASMLDVRGGIQVTDTTASGFPAIFYDISRNKGVSIERGTTYGGLSAYTGGVGYDTILMKGSDFRVLTGSSPTETFRVDSSGKVAIGNSNPGALLDIGLAGTTLGTMRLEGDTSGYVQIQPSAAAGSWTMTLPANAGTNGYVLSTNGSGVTSWIPAGGGGSVTSVSSANTDIAVATGTSTPVLTLNSGTGNNQIVKLDGSAKLPAVDGSALTNLDAGHIASGTLPINRGGTAATSFAANAVIVSNGTGSALQALNCTSGQIITFDVSGYAVCGAGTSANFINGGNSFAANATLGTNDAYSLGFKTNNSVAMTILSGGNVGIGTTTPSGPLEVAGKIHINFPSLYYSSSNFPVVNHSVSSTYAGAVNAYSAGNDTVGAFHGAVANVSSSNSRSYALIGIGRADTSYNTAFTTAAVSNGAWLPGIGFAGYTAGTGSSAQIAAAINGVVDGTVSNGVLPTSIVLRTSLTDSSGLTERLRITSAGNIGINAAAPAEKLEVNGAVKLGTTATSNAGTIRWDGTNFQGYNGTAWANFVPNPPASGACDTTNTYTAAGTYAYTVPAGFATITIRLWGGGGAGGSVNTNLPSSAGGNSSIVSLGLVAGGGTAGETRAGGTAATYGSGGTASGGTINTNGGNGAVPTGGFAGAAGASPNGGAAGTAVSGNAAGGAGGAPGGGGSGAAYSSGPAYASGGGAGAYVEKTFTTATLLPGTTINDVIVGAGGTAAAVAVSGGAGGVGRVSIACSTTGAPAANDRGVVFLSSNQHQTDSNFVYTASGYVGIGTSTPDEMLVVSNGTTVGKYTTSGWTHSSDRRLKHDIQPLQDSLNKILQLQGVEYKFNSDPEQKQQVGFIAQQVEPIFPEVVVTDDHGYKSMIYSNLVAPLVESVKSLYHSLKGVEAKQNDQARAIAGKADQSEIEKLKSDNLAKEKEIQDLKLRLERLEKALEK